MRYLLPLVLVLLTFTGVWAADDGLVAYYQFNEGQGTLTRDSSGQGNDGTISGARFLKNASGYCLEFDGSASYVDCGSKPSLDLRQAVTLEAWLMPTGRPKGEPGVMGKQFSSFLLTYYHDGQVYWYIGAGGNNSNGPVPEGTWHLVTATFDGENIALYVDGKLYRTVTSRFKSIPAGGKFLIGCVAGAESAADPNYRNTAHFAGLMDEVKVWNRALSAAEIAQHAAVEAPRFSVTEPFTAVRPARSLRAGTLAAHFDSAGRLQVDNGRARMTVDSAFAYPGEEIGWNPLGEKGRAETGWKPVVSAAGDSLTTRAQGKLYSLQRRVALKGGVVAIEDTLTSRSPEPVGVISRHWVTSQTRFGSVLSPGGAENPTMFMQTARGGLSVLMEDNLSRLHFDSAVSVRANQGMFQISNLALAPCKSLTLKWILMPLPAGTGYFDFVNRVRERWRGNYTVEGPFNWISMTDRMLDDPATLKRWLDFKQCKVMALGEWLDYDPGLQDHVWPREEYKQRAIRARNILKSVQPDIKVIGCIETDWVTIYPEKIPGGEKLPVAGTGASGGLNAEQTKIIDDAKLPFGDSARRAANGTMTLELYMRGGKPQTALWVYPAYNARTGQGNYQYEFLMGQVKFLLDEVGLDGYYIDEFSQGWNGGIPTYGQWDGVSAQVDARTGKIMRLYTDCSLAGIDARVNLARAALSRGKVMVANTYATAMEECGLAVNRFSETQGMFNPMTWPDGEKPAVLSSMLRSNLASPLGLGIIGQPQLKDTARRIMKAVVTYLRHGMLYYHYAIEDIPLEGPGSGTYGPINHMYPIAITGLHEGWVEGKERTITCVSGTYQWRAAQAPRVLVFDLDGRPVDVKPECKSLGKTWQVTLKLQDWAQIAVIEAAAQP